MNNRRNPLINLGALTQIIRMDISHLHVLLNRSKKYPAIIRASPRIASHAQPGMQKNSKMTPKTNSTYPAISKTLFVPAGKHFVLFAKKHHLAQHILCAGEVNVAYGSPGNPHGVFYFFAMLPFSMPNRRQVFSVAAATSSSTGIPLIWATRWATKRTKEGSLRLPRMGSGAR